MSVATVPSMSPPSSVDEIPTSSPPVGPAAYTKKNFNGPCFVKVLVNNIVAGSIIGKSGSVIHQIESDTGSSLKLSPGNCYFPGTTDRLVVISGKQEQINSALLVIVDKLRDAPTGYGGNPEVFDASIPRPGSLQLRLVVPKSCVSAVIGRGGQQIKQMQELTNAKIQISNREGGLNERILTISGTFEALQRAAIAVAATIQSDPNLKDHMYVVYTPNNTPALAQGPVTNPYVHNFGPTQQYIQQQPQQQQQQQAYVHNIAAPPPSSNPELLNHACEIVLQIPDASVGPVIGKNGVCLGEIIFSSGARIRISPKGEMVEGTQDRRCVIRGSVAAVHAAHIMLLQRLEAVEAQTRQNQSFVPGVGLDSAGGVVGSGYVNTRGEVELGY
eukprot:GHVS01057266.1.p1 GENE.GHVS01057266.1~~GHVS01057266.1.p1  ORF type:complete len:387 (+),score=59.48 GHVS01057266.1:188-1348(+)